MVSAIGSNMAAVNPVYLKTVEKRQTTYQNFLDAENALGSWEQANRGPTRDEGAHDQYKMAFEEARAAYVNANKELEAAKAAGATVPEKQQNEQQGNLQFAGNPIKKQGVGQNLDFNA